MENTTEKYAFFDAKDRNVLNNYFKLKNKYEHAFTPEEFNEFKNLVTAKLYQLRKQLKFKYVVIPETTNQQFLDILSMFDTISVKKNDIEALKRKLKEQPFQKKEWEKLAFTLESMDTIKMANIAGNQRARFVECLFDKIDIDAPFIIMDDGEFSGCTLNALDYATNNKALAEVVLFSKTA